MSQLPRLAGYVSLNDHHDAPVGGMYLTIKRHDGTEVKFKYDTHIGRWFWYRGGFCSYRDVIRALFDGEPGSGADELMADVGELIGQLMTETEFYVKRRRDLETQRYIERWRNVHSEPRSKTHVYLMKHSNGLTKIGCSSNPKARERTLQAEDPRLEMICCFKAHNHVEKRLHSIFQDLRVRGEWFRLEERHVEWIMLILSRAESNLQ